jgi:TPR repeat protein
MLPRLLRLRRPTISRIGFKNWPSITSFVSKIDSLPLPKWNRSFSTDISATNEISADLKSLRERVRQGDAEALFQLGIRYCEGNELKQSNERGFIWLQRAAEAGHAGAQYSLGVMLDEGRGMTPSPTDAALWFNEAAEQGLAVAQNKLGMYHLTGVGVGGKNPEAALHWFRLAAGQGEVSALFNLGTCLFHGLGTEVDQTRGLGLWELAAEKGSENAQYAVATILIRNGHESSRAIELLKKAAAAGHNFAEWELAEFHLSGKLPLVPKDLEEGIRLLKIGSEKKFPYSQRKLSECYEHGIGVTLDRCLLLADSREMAQRLRDDSFKNESAETLTRSYPY